MTTLYDRLEHVADLDGSGHPVPQTEVLWQRGHRWRSRRRAGTAVLVGAACLALVGLGLAGWRTSTQDDLRPASSPAGLPDRVWVPSPTLPGTDSTGPLGRIALVTSTERAGWWSSSVQPLAISAETGEYAFLDVPRFARGTELSPDGRHVAYWVTGEPSGSPPEDGEPVTGFAVYNTSTGETRIQEVPTEHSMVPGDLIWTDEQTLLVNFTQALGGRGDDDMDQSTSSYQPIWVWRLEETEAAPDPILTDAIDTYSLQGGGHGLVWWTDSDGGGIQVLPAREPTAAVGLIPLESPMMSHSVAVDAAGTRAAGGARNRNPSSVKWASIADGPLGTVSGTERTFRVLAWVDASRVLVLQSPELYGPSKDLRPMLRLVDVTTGESEDVVTPVQQSASASQSALERDISVAWELATEPTFVASEPPDPISQRTLVGWSVAAVVAALAALLLWRRRVEP
jgi:hypothetical protein